MEFKLNKIDTDIRKKIDEERKTSKVHSGKGINVNKDTEDEKSKGNVTEEKESRKRKRFFTIDGIKYSKNEVQIEVEKKENLDVQNSIGRVLDTKK